MRADDEDRRALVAAARARPHRRHARRWGERVVRVVRRVQRTARGGARRGHVGTRGALPLLLPPRQLQRHGAHKHGGPAGFGPTYRAIVCDEVACVRTHSNSGYAQMLLRGDRFNEIDWDEELQKRISGDTPVRV